MKINNKEKASIVLFVICWLVYAIISMTKTAFSSSIASIVQEGILTKSLAGTINAAYYIFYGGAQLLLVKFVDIVSPFKLINISLLGAIISMVGFALADNFVTMLVLWSVTGLLQFALWPAIIRIIAQYLLPEHRAKAMVGISFSYCAGMIANFFAASLILKLSGWRMIFWVFLGVIILTTVLWYVLVKKTTPLLDVEKVEIKNDKKPQVSVKKVIFTSGIMFLLVPSFVRTMMDLGLKSWVPTMITETYADVSPSFANILTTILMIVNLSGIYIVKKVQGKWIKNDALCFGFCFVVSLPFTAMLLLIGKIPVALVVVLLTIVTTFMYSGHQLINVIIPAEFGKFNMSGSVASILNSVASFGAVAASFGYGYLADNYGWGATVMSWNIMAVIAAVFAFLAVKQWKRFVK